MHQDMFIPLNLFISLIPNFGAFTLYINNKTFNNDLNKKAPFATSEAAV